MIDLGDRKAGTTLHIPINTKKLTDGELINPSGLVVGDLAVYKDGSTVENTNGITLSGFPYDTDLPGLALITIDLSDTTVPDFYLRASNFFLAVKGSATVDGNEIQGYVIATWSIETRMIDREVYIDEELDLRENITTPTPKISKNDAEGRVQRYICFHCGNDSGGTEKHYGKDVLGAMISVQEGQAGKSTNLTFADTTQLVILGGYFMDSSGAGAGVIESIFGIAAELGITSNADFAALGWTGAQNEFTPDEDGWTFICTHSNVFATANNNNGNNVQMWKTVAGALAGLQDLTAAEVNAQADAAIETYRLDELMAVALASQPLAESLFGDLTENDGGTQRFNANALEQAPTGASAAQVWAYGTRTLTGIGGSGIASEANATTNKNAILTQGGSGPWTTGSGGDATEAKQDQILAGQVTTDSLVTANAAAIATVQSTADAIKDKTDKLPEGFKKNTAKTGFMFEMVDSSDGRTAKTGLTVTAQKSIDGGSYSATTNSPSEVGSGTYKIDLSAADLNGTNFVMLKFTAAGADTRKIEILLVD